MAALPLNAVIGKYRIDSRLGHGGRAEVYRTTNLQSGMTVAVKVLTLREPDTGLARSRNEAVLHNLRHPHVAEPYEYFQYQGQSCIAMEFVEGRTLEECLRDTGRLEPDKALEILAEICDAVSYLHSKGTIHGDINAQNIRITSHAGAKLLDFGISWSRDLALDTPSKMAPEQHRGLSADARSDVWALGLLLYEMVTGVEPFANKNPTGLRDDILALRYIPAAKRNPALAEPIGRMISKCLRSNPEERYASSGLMLREVQQARRCLARDRRKDLSANQLTLVAASLALLILVFYAFSSVTAVQGEAEDGGPARKSATASHAGDQKTVRLATYDGPAEVLSENGQRLGSTPYLLTGTLGKRYELWLTRPGFQRRRVDLQISNKDEYLLGLERIEGRLDSGMKE